MKFKAYVLVFDGLADWEPALALCEINKSKKFDVLSVGFSGSTIISMGGWKIVPDIPLEDMKLEEAAIFIMPGGERWEKGRDEALIKLLHKFQASGTVIAAICGATLEVARAGLMNGRRHTSNSQGYLKAMIPDYRGEDFYVDKPAVVDGNLITASGLGSVEFACEIVRLLNIYSPEEIEELYDMFKNAVIPTRYVI